MVSRFPGASSPPGEAYRVARGAPCALAGGRAGVDSPGPAPPNGERVKVLSNDGTVTLLLRGATVTDVYRCVDGWEVELLSSVRKAFVVARGDRRTLVVIEEFRERLSLYQFFLRYGLVHSRITGYVTYRSLKG